VGAHEAVSRRPPNSLCRIVARTEGYTYDVGVWDLSIVQGPSPCAKPGHVPIRNLSIAVRRVATHGGACAEEG
jgi:hypothetical protein